jgi:SRSO17 transposase
MERRYQIRFQELMDECEADASLFEDITERLRIFVTPFCACLETQHQQELAQTYVAGLVSDLERKNTESIAYRHDQDRQPLQRFVGNTPWDHRPLVAELVRQVGAELGASDGVIVFDPSGFVKKGNMSVGVQRQWIGRVGKIDNGQVGVYMGYASSSEHALVDFRLFFPKEWEKDKKRRRRCGVPSTVRHQTRHALALEMLAEQGPLLPHAWVAGDDEMGRSSGFRNDLRELDEKYLLAVPSNTLIRDLLGDPPPYGGRGPIPKQPFVRVDNWCATLPEVAWTRIDVRDGEKGPLTIEIVETRVEAKTERGGTGPEETLVVTRERDEKGAWKHDYYLSNATPGTPLTEFARVAKAEHRIEECIKRAKSEAGLADYEVRTWLGWHHHQTLSLLAAWFLVQETRRGKENTPSLTLPQVRSALAEMLHQAFCSSDADRIARSCTRRLRRNEQARYYHWKERKQLAPLRINQRC